MKAISLTCSREDQVRVSVLLFLTASPSLQQLVNKLLLPPFCSLQKITDILHKLILITDGQDVPETQQTLSS